MQLRAIDQENRLISVTKAERQKEYLCLECGGVVKLRGGLHRQNHFYHLNPNRTCKLSEKSMEHIQVQYYMIDILPKDEAFLEHRFPNINRIADVFWLPRNLVFEIQCSNISMQEVRQRNSDYQKLGLQVIWILHDKRFNKWRLSAAEIFLKSFPHYFTDMDIDGKGIIYDQFEILLRGIREKSLSPQPINLSFPKEIQQGGSLNIPQLILERMKSWTLCFEGDLIHQVSHPKVDTASYFSEALDMEVAYIAPQISLSKRILNALVKPYWFVFKILLERACK